MSQSARSETRGQRLGAIPLSFDRADESWDVLIPCFGLLKNMAFTSSDLLMTRATWRDGLIWSLHASGTARAARCRFFSVDNHSIHHGEHGVHREVRTPGAISDNSSHRVSACKRHGASRPVQQKGWSHFLTPAYHQNLRRPHVAPSGLCLLSGIGHGLAPHGYIMPPRLGLTRTAEAG